MQVLSPIMAAPRPRRALQSISTFLCPAQGCPAYHQALRTARESSVCVSTLSDDAGPRRKPDSSRRHRGHRPHVTAGGHDRTSPPFLKAPPCCAPSRRMPKQQNIHSTLGKDQVVLPDSPDYSVFRGTSHENERLFEFTSEKRCEGHPDTGVGPDLRWRIGRPLPHQGPERQGCRRT